MKLLSCCLAGKLRVFVSEHSLSTLVMYTSKKWDFFFIITSNKCVYLVLNYFLLGLDNVLLQHTVNAHGSLLIDFL